MLNTCLTHTTRSPPSHHLLLCNNMYNTFMLLAVAVARTIVVLPTRTTHNSVCRRRRRRRHRLCYTLVLIGDFSLCNFAARKFAGGLVGERVIEGQHQYACTCPIVVLCGARRRRILRRLVGQQMCLCLVYFSGRYALACMHDWPAMRACIHWIIYCVCPVRSWRQQCEHDNATTSLEPMLLFAGRLMLQQHHTASRTGDGKCDSCARLPLLLPLQSGCSRTRLLY